MNVNKVKEYKTQLSDSESLYEHEKNNNEFLSILNYHFKETRLLTIIKNWKNEKGIYWYVFIFKKYYFRTEYII